MLRKRYHYTAAAAPQPRSPQRLHLMRAGDATGPLKLSWQGGPRTRETLAHPNYAWLAAQLHPTKNGSDLQLGGISLGCGAVLWWQCQGCPKCGRVHEWQARVSNRAGILKRGCPSCAVFAIGSGSACLPCFCRSVAVDARISREWCSEGNGGVQLEAVTLNSTKKRMWRCLRHPSHSAYQAAPTDRSKGVSGCPECGKEASRVKTKRATLAEEHPELAAQWDHELNDRTFGNITSGSDYMASWICPESTCEHTHQWKAKVGQRTQKKHRTGCLFCSGLVCCPCNSVAGKFPELLQEWAWARNRTLGLNPYKISPYSHKRLVGEMLKGAAGNRPSRIRLLSLYVHG